MRLACVITTYNRISEAKGQMDLIKEFWEPKFGRIDIYHEYDGERSWYKGKYKEDYFFRHPYKPHLEGALYLINKGIEHALANKRKYDFIVVSSADVWIYNPTRLLKIINKCRRAKYEVATSIWYLSGFSTEFFIISPSLARSVFPLDYKALLKKHRIAKILDDFSKLPYLKTKKGWFIPTTVELLFSLKLLKVLKDPRKIYLIPGRSLVLLHNRFSTKGFYSSHHDLSERKAYMKEEVKNRLKYIRRNSEYLYKILGE